MPGIPGEVAKVPVEVPQILLPVEVPAVAVEVLVLLLAVPVCGGGYTGPFFPCACRIRGGSG